MWMFEVRVELGLEIPVFLLLHDEEGRTSCCNSFLELDLELSPKFAESKAELNAERPDDFLSEFILEFRLE